MGLPGGNPRQLSELQGLPHGCDVTILEAGEAMGRRGRDGMTSALRRNSIGCFPAAIVISRLTTRQFGRLFKEAVKAAGLRKTLSHGGARCDRPDARCDPGRQEIPFSR
jgi:hypothetical protein